MAIPEGAEAPNEEEIKDSVPELKVVKDKNGIEKTEGEPLTGTIKEVSNNSERWTGQTEPTEEAVRKADELEVERKEQDRFDTHIRESKRDDIRERGRIKKFLGLK